MNKVAALLALSLAPAFAVATAVEAEAAVPVQGSKKGFHANPKYGFQFKPPKGWDNVALKQNEQWLGAKYKSDKSYFYHDKLTGQTDELVPEMMLICFIKNQDDDTKVEETDEGVKITLNPYKDYDDFLKNNFAGGGYFKDKTKETKVGKIPVTQHLYRVEKLTTPKFIVTWIYHTEDIDYAFQTVVFQSEYKKMKSLLERSYKSFKLIERSGESLTQEGMSITFITRREMEAEDPKERRTKRIESESQVRKRAVDTLPDDWDVNDKGDALVLSHVDKKLAKRFGEHVDALIQWLEATFPYYGKGEYCRKPIVRICKDRDEALSYMTGTGTNTFGQSGGAPDVEILTYKPGGGFSGNEVDYVNSQVMNHWFYEKDSDLWQGLPQWLKGGLFFCIEGLRKDGRKMKWRENDYDRTLTMEYRAKGIATEPREFMRFTYMDFADAGGEADRETFSRNRYTSYAFVRFLLSKEAQKNKYTKDLLETYILTLDAVNEEMAERIDDLSDYDEPKTEEEEAAQAAARGERFRELERETVDAAFERAFGEWGDEEWESVHKAFWDWL